MALVMKRANALFIGGCTFQNRFNTVLFHTNCTRTIQEHFVLFVSSTDKRFTNIVPFILARNMSDKAAVITLMVGLLAAIPGTYALTNPQSIDSEFRDAVRGCNAAATVWLRAAFHE